MDSCLYVLEWLYCFSAGRLHFYFKRSTTGLRPGNRETGAEHIWAKINLNGKKSLKRGSNFLVFLPRCSCKYRNPVMSIAICVKITCFDATQLYSILFCQFLRKTHSFLRSAPIESKYSLESLLSCFFNTQHPVDQQWPFSSCSYMWKFKCFFFPPFFLFKNHTDWHPKGICKPVQRHPALSTHVSFNKKLGGLIPELFQALSRPSIVSASGFC